MVTLILVFIIFVLTLVFFRRRCSSCRRRSKVLWWWAKSWRWSTHLSSTTKCRSCGRIQPTRRWSRWAAGSPTWSSGVSSSTVGSDTDSRNLSGFPVSSFHKVHDSFTFVYILFVCFVWTFLLLYASVTRLSVLSRCYLCVRNGTLPFSIRLR